jgi:hypothetical protein
VRHHAAITLLRHGNAADIRDFFESVLKVDPKDAFAQFVMSLLDSYDISGRQGPPLGDQDGPGPRPSSSPVPYGGNRLQTALCVTSVPRCFRPTICPRCRRAARSMSSSSPRRRQRTISAPIRYLPV